MVGMLDRCRQGQKMIEEEVSNSRKCTKLEIHNAEMHTTLPSYYRDFSYH
jgi:hypothetical protein